MKVAIWNPLSLGGWPGLIAYTLFFAFVTWIAVSGPRAERDAVDSRCVGIPLMLGEEGPRLPGGVDRERTATYFCMPGYLSGLDRYRVMSRNGVILDVQEERAWNPLFLTIALLYPAGMWSYLYLRRRRTA